MAENILGLLLEIGGNPAGAIEALEKVKASSVAESADISSLWSGAMEAITGPTGIALGAIVGLGGGMLEAAKHAAELGNQVYETSEKTGIGAEKVSGLMAIAKETGGSFEGLSTALARAGVNLEKTNESGGKANKLLYALEGGAKGAAELGLKPMDERVQILLHRIFSLTDVGQRNLALQELLGRGFQENASALKILAEQGYGPAIEAARKFGIFFDENSAEQARKFTIGMNELTAEVQSLGLAIGEKLIPFINGWMQGLQGLLPRIEAWGDATKAVFLAVTHDFAGAALAWADYHKRLQESDQAQTDFLVHLDNLTTGAKHAGDALHPKLSGKTKKVKDAIEEAAEASHKFWEKFNAGLTEGEFKLPKFETEFQRLAKTIDDVAKQANSDDWKRLEAFLSGDFKAAGLSAGAGPAITDPFGPLGQSAAKAMPPIHNLTDVTSKFLQQLLKVPGAYFMWNASLDKFKTESSQWLNQVGLMRESLQLFENTGKQAFTSIGNAMGQAAANAIVYGKNFGAAMEQALKSTLASIAAQAITHAIFETAYGFADLAIHDYKDASLHFEAAGIFASIGAVAGGIGAAIPGGGSSGSAAKGGYGVGGSAGTVTPRGPAGLSGAGGGPQIQINIDGVISADTMDEIAPQLAEAVTGAYNSGAAPLPTLPRPNVLAGR